jgi:ubiquinone/menaquinone biosynthesis C-methylase UbiE
VYATKPTDRVSWYQPHAEISLALIASTGLPSEAAIIDIGGGASTLVDDLLQAGYQNISVLDIATAALQKNRDRLGNTAARVHWIEGDITRTAFPDNAFDLWHDRAVFHFLTEGADRQAYVRAASRAIKPGGHLIVATFAEDGPQQCSGLPVARYSAAALHAEFSRAFQLIETRHEAHRTPFATEQRFVYCHWRKLSA